MIPKPTAWAALLVSLCCACTLGPIPATTPVPTAAPAPGWACLMADGTPITTAFLPFTKRWGDTLTIVQSTARINLTAPVTELQSIRRDVEQTLWPSCARHAADLLIEGMNTEIGGYLAFMAVPGADERVYVPDFGNLTYGQLVAEFGVDQANALFFANSYAAIAKGTESFTAFGIELAYADGEQARPAS